MNRIVGRGIAAWVSLACLLLASAAWAAPVAQTITFANPGAQTFGSSPNLSILGGGASATSGLAVSFSSSTTGVCTITSGGVLTFVTAGTCTINADQGGDSNFLPATQVSRSFTVIAVAPGAPTGVVATRGDTQVSVAFTPPASNGGSAITGYTVTASPADVAPVTGASSPIVVTGLTNGQPYTFTVTADNVAGTGPASVASNSAMPGATQTVTFNNPGPQTFGTAPTFTATSDSGLTPTFTSSTTGVCTITSLGAVTFVTAGTCTINADQAGDGSYLPATQVSRSFAVNPILPGAPTITGATAGENQVTLTLAPSSNGGAAIVSYSLTATPGGATRTCTSSPCVFPGLTSGVAYTFVARATNSVGSSATSAPSAPATPFDPPPPPEPEPVSQAIGGFTANPSAPVFKPGGTFTVSASGGGSSAPVVIAVAPSSAAVCQISGTSVTMLAAGTCSLTADQAGADRHLAAPTARLEVPIAPATPALSWVEDLVRTFGDPAFELPDPTSPSRGAFTFASSNASVAQVSGRTVALAGPGEATLTATQAAAGDYAGASVVIRLQVLARPDPAQDATIASAGQAQVDAAVRFALAQQANIQTRLRGLRSQGGGNPSNNGLTFNLHSAAGRDLSLPAGQFALGEGGLPEGWGLWAAGALVFDERRAGDGFAGFEVRSEGLSIGLDRQINDQLILGAAAGVGWNDADVAGSPSGVEGAQGSLSAYGLWRAGEHVFAEGLLGWGRLEFDMTRWSEAARAQARASRSGDQLFGSMTLGYEQRGPRGAIAGYGRLDASRTSLDAYQESGLGLFDLAYREQTIDSSSLSIGVDGDRLFKHGETAWRPFWLVEYRTALRNSGDQAINYVVRPATSDFVLSLRSFNDDALVLGAGLDLHLPAGWLVSFSYRREDGSELDSNGYAVSVTYRGERK